MKRKLWAKQVGSCLLVVAMFTATAYADPVGTASVFQFVDAKVFPADETAQQTFRTSDEIGFRAVYFDPNPACAGVAPFLAQLFIFTAEGLFLAQISAGIDAGGVSKYRGVFQSFASAASIPLTPGSYAATFLVRDCANTKSIVLMPFLSFRVVAP